MANQRIIKFKYYKITYDECIDGVWVEKGGFNLSDWVVHMDGDNKVQKLLPAKGSEVRIEKIDQDDEKKYWIIRFLKKRIIAPSKCKDGLDAEDIGLEDGEYIGEDVTILYHREKNIVMMQMNRVAVTPGVLEALISNNFYDKSKKIKVHLKPIYDEGDKFDFRDKIIRTIEINFANVNEGISDKKRSMSEMFGIMRKYHGLTGKVVISVSRDKKAQLNGEKIQDVIDEIQNDKTGVSGLKVKYKEVDEAPIESVDLFEDTKYELIEVMQEDNKPLDFMIMKNKMVSKYKSRGDL